MYVISSFYTHMLHSQAAELGRFHLRAEDGQAEAERKQQEGH